MSFRSGGRGGGWNGGGGGGWNGGGRGGGGGGGGGQWGGSGGNRGGGGGGGWGNQGGNRGNDGWQNQGNRFGAFQQPRSPHQQSQQGGGRGGGGGGGGGGGSRPQETPEEAVRNDLQTEKPIWLLSCYSHAREGPNDLTGDVSFEEVRWSNLQDMRAHRTPLSINADFKGAMRAKQEELNALLARARDRRGGALPSLGGPPIHVQNAWLAQFLTLAVGQPQLQPQMAGGFGAPGQPQPGGFSFGTAPQQQLPPSAPGGFGAAPAGFGQPVAAAGFGQPAAPGPVTGGFGQPAAAAGGFAQAGGFGAAPPSGFGAPPQPPQAGFGQNAPGAPFGQPAGGGFAAGGGGFGAGGAGPGKGSWMGQGGFGGAQQAGGQAPALPFGQNMGPQPGAPNAITGGAFVPTPAPGQQAFPGFNQSTSTSGPLLGFGSPTMVAPAAPRAAGFGMAPAAVPPAGAPPAEGAATATGDGAASGPGEDELQAFKAATFTLGKIPEVPPPPELCY